MQKQFLAALLFPLLITAPANAQEMPLTAEENAAVAAILAKARQEQEKPAPKTAPISTQAASPSSTDNKEDELDKEEPAAAQKCLTVAFVDIDKSYLKKKKLLKPNSSLGACTKKMAALRGSYDNLNRFMNVLWLNLTKCFPDLKKMRTNWSWAMYSIVLLLPEPMYFTPAL